LATAGNETLVAWEAVDEVNYDPLALAYAVRPAGGDFGLALQAPGAHAGALAGRSDGTAVAVWNAAGLRVSARPPGGDFGAAQPVSSRAGFQIAVAGDAVAWLEGGAIRVTRIGPS
jgi:hypothetical protein